VTPTAIAFILHGLLGAVLSVLVSSKNPRELAKYESIKDYVLGAVAGYIYYLMHVSYHLPDSVVAVAVGYFARDFIVNVMQWLRQSIRGGLS